MESVLLGYCAFMSVVAALGLKRESDILFFLESFHVSKTDNPNCIAVRDKKTNESTMTYLKAVSKNDNYSDILKCNL